MYHFYRKNIQIARTFQRTKTLRQTDGAKMIYYLKNAHMSSVNTSFDCEYINKKNGKNLRTVSK